MRSVPIERSVGAIALVIACVAVAIAIAWKIHASDLRWSRAAAASGGDPVRGEAMFIQYGCGSCHQLDSVRKAGGKVGPPLDGLAERAMIAGKLANSPDNLERWIRDPQEVTPGTDMPDLHVGERDARDITAFLYTRTP